MHVKNYRGSYSKDEVILHASEKLGPNDLYFIRKGFSSGVMLDKSAPEKNVMAVKYIRLNFSNPNRLRVTFGTNMWAWFLYFFGTAAIASFFIYDHTKNFGAYFIFGYIGVAYYVTREAIIKVVDRVLYN